jgi:hypothetical protein
LFKRSDHLCLDEKFKHPQVKKIIKKLLCRK